jgi:hypothetical protein
VNYGDGIQKAVKSRVDQELRAGLDRAGVQVVDETTVRNAIADADCVGADCAGIVATAAGATYLVYAQVTNVSRDYEVTVQLVSPTGEVLASTDEACEICGLDEVAGVVESRVSAIAKEIDARSEASGPMLIVRSTPSGATLYVDDVPVGDTPYAGPVSEGEHVIRLEKHGFAPAEQTLKLAAGVRSPVKIDLRREFDQSKKLQGAGWGALATGVVFLGAAGALIAIDSNQNSRRCTGQDVDNDGDCRFVFQTKWGGAALAVGGGALVAAGVALLVTTRKGRDHEDRRVQARIGPGSAGLVAHF